MMVVRELGRNFGPMIALVGQVPDRWYWKMNLGHRMVETEFGRYIACFPVMLAKTSDLGGKNNVK